MTPRWQVIHGDCREVLPTLGQVDHVITDPPYSEHVHKAARHGAMVAEPGKGKAAFFRNTDLGFAYLEPELRAFVSAELGRLSRRWSLVFADVEGAPGWVADLMAAGLEYVRTGAWVKVGATPQFSGDRPAAGFEAIAICHPKGRKRWNGGGRHAVWSHPIVLDRGGHPNRVHTTQKPLPLMLELVELFTDPDDLVLDPFCGSGTTGVACLRLGRRFIGIERDEKYAAVARERLEAESQGLTLRDARAGQLPMFGGEP